MHQIPMPINEQGLMLMKVVPILGEQRFIHNTQNYGLYICLQGPFIGHSHLAPQSRRQG